MKRKLALALLLTCVLLPSTLGVTIRCINIMQARICSILDDDGNVIGSGVVINP
jgi:hypothetical protein